MRRQQVRQSDPALATPAIVETSAIEVSFCAPTALKGSLCLSQVFDSLGAETVSEEVRRAGTGQLPPVPARTDEIHGWLIATVRGTNPTSDMLRVLDTRTWLLDVATDLSEIVGAPRDDMAPWGRTSPLTKERGS